MKIRCLQTTGPNCVDKFYNVRHIDCCLFPPILFSSGKCLSTFTHLCSTQPLVDTLSKSSGVSPTLHFHRRQYISGVNSAMTRSPRFTSTCHPPSWLAGELILLQILILSTSIHVGFSFKCQSETKKFKLANSLQRYHAPTRQVVIVCMTKISGILLQYKRDDRHITITCI